MTCSCRKGAVVAGCPRHSVLTPSHRRRHVSGWWHRFLIHEAQIVARWYERASTREKLDYWFDVAERRRNGEDVQTTGRAEES